jgi:Leucine-rich repeat (LRR) protein
VVRNGPLQELPRHMEQLSELTEIDFRFNELKEFNVDISKWKALAVAWLHFNKIKKMHESVWKHSELVTLALNSNKGLAFPESIYLPQLLYFHAGNNSVQIPATLGNAQFPAVLFLYLNGNMIPRKTFPKDFETLSTLRYLGVARTGLKEVPSETLMKFNNLRYLDARDNNISAVDDSLTRYLKAQKVNEIYFGGNKGLDCKTVASTDCDKSLCSKYCYSKYHKNKFCDASCNSKACNFDEGDCLR